MANPFSSNKENSSDTTEHSKTNKMSSYLTDTVGQSEMCLREENLLKKADFDFPSDYVPPECTDSRLNQCNYSPTQRKNKLRLPMFNDENKKLKVGLSFDGRVPFQPVENNVSRNGLLKNGSVDTHQWQRGSIKKRCRAV